MTTFGEGAFAPDPGIRASVEGIGEWYIVDDLAAPDERTGDDVYATMTRVREWDRIYAAGWIPIDGGYVRRIESIE
jgi:hypothetical protein